eukprot:2023639-Prorocentrum_lima.AAC.1
MWDSGASHFLLPLDQLPKGATDTRKAIDKLAMGHAPASFWKGEFFCKECSIASIGPGASCKWKKAHLVDQEWRYM